jgi:hypothetical protein
VRWGNNEWRIVGEFTDGGSVSESEIWTDVRVLQGAYSRGDTFQTVRVLLTAPGSFTAFRRRLTSDPRLSVNVLTEREFYAAQSVLLSTVIHGAGTVLALLMGVGAVFGALNTMYSAVATRGTEIATLRALGFGGLPVAVSVLSEALLLGLIGGIIGAAIAYLGFDGLQTSTINYQSFTQVSFAFRVTPALILVGTGYALLLALIGGQYTPRADRSLRACGRRSPFAFRPAPYSNVTAVLTMAVLTESELEHFRTFGWVRVPGAFAPEAAALMTTAIWEALGRVGIHRDDPATWITTRPEHLQHLKAHPAFRAIGTRRTIDSIRDVLADQDLPTPKNWGAFFLHFPTTGEWSVPASGWHMDGDYAGELEPPCGVLIHAMLTEVGPRCGGTNILSGSHRLLHRWFRENVPAPGSRSAQLRRSLQRHPYIRDLCTAGDRTERIARFHEQIEVVDGLPLQVVENVASPGDLVS